MLNTFYQKMSISTEFLDLFFEAASPGKRFLNNFFGKQRCTLLSCGGGSGILLPPKK